jgi:hypothetical protein
VQTEENFVSQSKFGAFDDFCKIEIKKTSEDLDLLKNKINVCLTKDEKHEAKLSGLNQTIMEIKSKFNAALEASKCQEEKNSYELENKSLKEENAALKKKLVEQQEDLEKKYKMELARELEDKL